MSLPASYRLKDREQPLNGILACCDHEHNTGVILRDTHSALRARNRWGAKILRGSSSDVTEAKAFKICIKIYRPIRGPGMYYDRGMGKQWYYGVEKSWHPQKMVGFD